jgi:GTP pyrophosphokinase
MLVQEPERRLEIDWKELEGEKFMVRLALEATDRRGLYADLATAVSATGTDIRSFELHSSDGHVIGELAVEVGNLAHLQKILKAARRVKGVTDVARRERLSSDVKNGQSGIWAPRRRATNQEHCGAGLKGLERGDWFQTRRRD